MRRRTFLRLSAGAITAVPVGAAPFRDAAALAEPGAAAHPGAGPAAHPGKRPSIIVGKDVDTVQAAVDAAPAGAATTYTIGILPGLYQGQVIVPASRTNLAFRGLGHRPDDVIVADNRANGTPRPDGSGTWGTSGSASVTIDGAGFRADNLTFANLFDEAANPGVSRQAVAVLTRADRVSFRHVRFLGKQDTLYVNSSAAGVIARASFEHCYVEGDVDFIFGRASAVFDRCRIHSLARTGGGYVSAPSTDSANPYGFLFTHCVLTGDPAASGVFLGRPWHPSNDPLAIGAAVFRETLIGPHVGPAAWSDFGTWPWREARLAEYHNRGPGAVITEDRPQLTRAEAATHTAAAYLRDWKPSH